MVKALSEKAGVFRTVEALIAIFITFFFLSIYLPQQRLQATETGTLNVLANVQDNDEFRNCVIQENLTCINQSIERNIEGRYQFQVNLTRDANTPTPGLPAARRIQANTLFLAGNSTNSTQFIVRLYFWTKSGQNETGK